MSGYRGTPDTIHPEDIEPGIFMAVSALIEDEEEDLTDGWRAEPVQNQGSIALKLMQNANKKDMPDLTGRPFVVVTYDHPFVVGLMTQNGMKTVIDVRKHEFVRVSEEFASFIVDEALWRKQYQVLFQGRDVRDPSALPEGMMRQLLQRGGKVLRHAKQILREDQSEEEEEDDLIPSDLEEIELHDTQQEREDDASHEQ